MVGIADKYLVGWGKTGSSRHGGSVVQMRVVQITISTTYNLKTLEFYRTMSEEELSQSLEPEVAGFVAKTFQILKNQEYGKIIFWGASGRDFIIKDVNKFQEIVLPKYFRHKKINSFIRQLNMYGFHKSRKDNAKSIFSHPNFLRDRDDLLSTIKRKIKVPELLLKTPNKEKCSSEEKKVAETAVKEIETSKKVIIQEPSQIALGFFESKEYMHSIFNLNLSLKKVSMNELDPDRMDHNDDEDKLSIQLGIEKRVDEFLDDKIVNPSLFFSSWRDPQEILKQF